MTNIRSKLNQILASTVVTVGVFGMGTVLGWSSPALPSMNQEKYGFFVNLSLEAQSWIGSSATLGAFAACPFGGLGIDKIGRKSTLLVATVPFAVAWLVIASAKTVWLICIGRFLSGFCGGIFTLTAPVYIGEVASNNIRGMLMNAFQVMLVTGILFSYLLGTFLSWQGLSYICATIPGIFLLFSFFIPESPRYLLSKGDISGAQKSLAWFRGCNNNSISGTLPPETRQEFESLQKIVEESRMQTTKFRDLLKPNVLKPLGISLSLMVLEQLSAFNVVIFYCVDIFTAAGIQLNSYWASNIVAVIQVVVTILATPLVDMAGRRILLLISEAFMGLSFISLGTFFYIKGQGAGVENLAWLPMLSVIVFIVAFAIGIGPLSWTVMGEILHPDVKGLCSAIAVSLVWFSAFIVTKIYSSLVEGVGIAWAFWIFSLVSIGGTFIVYFCVPETKGKSLDEIQQLFVKGGDSNVRETRNESDNNKTSSSYVV